MASWVVPQNLEMEGKSPILMPAGSACCVDPWQWTVSALLTHLGTVKDHPPEGHSWWVQGWEASCKGEGVGESIPPLHTFLPTFVAITWSQLPTDILKQMNDYIMFFSF